MSEPAAMPPRSGADPWVIAAIDAEKGTPTSWLLCRTRTMLFALPIDSVVEIMRMLPVEALAGAPEYILGLSIVRGVPVPVVEAGMVVSHEAGDPARLISVKAAARTIALAVDEVIGITAIAADSFDELPPLLGAAATDTIAGIGARDGGLLALLRAGRLVPDEVFARFEEAGAPS